MQTVIPSEALGAKTLNLDLVPAEVHGWKEGRNFRYDSQTAVHRDKAARFCEGVTPEALDEMAANGVDLITLQAKFAGQAAQISYLKEMLRRAAR